MSDNNAFAFSILVIVGVVLATMIGRSIEWLIFGAVATVGIVVLGGLVAYFVYSLPATIKAITGGINDLRPNVTNNIYIEDKSQLPQIEQRLPMLEERELR